MGKEAQTLWVSQEDTHTGLRTKWEFELTGTWGEACIVFSCAPAQKYSPLS